MLGQNKKQSEHTKNKLQRPLHHNAANITLGTKCGAFMFFLRSEYGVLFAAPRRIMEKYARRPVSRVLSPPRTAGDGHSSGTSVAGRLARPTRATARKPARPFGLSPLLGLAPGGVYRAAAVAGGAVRSYRTLSPLPVAGRTPGDEPLGANPWAGGLLSVALSLGSPPPGVTRHRVSVEPGLSSPALLPPIGEAARRRPSGRLTLGT